ncbi:MAG: Fur family transcriptional regulator [Bacillota bacterium]
MEKREANKNRAQTSEVGRPVARMTRQRQIILEELRKVTSHPTADEVYEMVRKRMPHISLGTVYRNLELLSGVGEIQTLELAGTQKRFDGNPANHYHARCLKCGRVTDLDLPVKALNGLEDVIAEASGFKVVGHRLKFLGLCPRCQKEEQKQRDR